MGDQISKELEPGSTPRPPTEGSLTLPCAIVDEIIAHARQDAPRECCGLIAGRNGRLEELYRLTNLAPGNRLYEIDPREIYELEFRTLPARELEVVAIYHSHPVTEAYPSPTDQAQAFWSDVSYLICSLADPHAPVIRAFRLGGPEVEEIQVKIDGERA